MKDIARRPVEDGFEILQGGAPLKPGRIKRPNGTTFPTHVSVAAILKGMGWQMLPSSEKTIKDQWRKK